METDLKEIKETSVILFDAVPVEEKIFGIVQHPFIDNIHVCEPRTGKMLNLSNPEDYKGYRDKFVEFMTSGDIYRVLSLIRPAWLMTWFKYCSQHMSTEDYGKFLAHCWVRQENPNQDVNVPLRLAIKFFRKAEKRHLMEPDEYKVYKDMPDSITVYRGVAKGRERYGLSWTGNREKAEWFMGRFGEGGMLLRATVSKKDILAYFNSRSEEEVVVDVVKIKGNVEEVA